MGRSRETMVVSVGGRGAEVVTVAVTMGCGRRSITIPVRRGCSSSHSILVAVSADGVPETVGIS